MADARSLLRAARESRKASSNKKRNATSLDDEHAHPTKKAKSSNAVPGVQHLDALEKDAETKDDKIASVHEKEVQTVSSGHDDSAADSTDLDAWEKELQEMEASMKQTDARTDVTISAAPMTAEQIAAQAREEQSAQRGRRDAELEAEREDAARLLEDEFEEMEGLEERARKLRERREALRKMTRNAASDRLFRVEVYDQNKIQGDYGNNPLQDDDDEGEEDEDLDDWNFGAR